MQHLITYYSRHGEQSLLGSQILIELKHAKVENQGCEIQFTC